MDAEVKRSEGYCKKCRQPLDFGGECATCAIQQLNKAGENIHYLLGRLQMAIEIVDQRSDAKSDYGRSQLKEAIWARDNAMKELETALRGCIIIGGLK